MSARLHRVEKLDCPVVPYDWPFARERRAEITAHWAKLVAQKPALFDGRVLLCRRPRFAQGTYSAQYFETNFSAFIAWRDFGFPDADVFNGFAMAALRAADGAFLLGEMAAHTANAGQSYFPAGTPDPSDIRAGAVDLAASVERELLEETGVAQSQTRVDPVWTIVELGPRIACMRALHMNVDAATAMAQVNAHLARETRPELAALHPVFTLSDLLALKTPDFIGIYLAHALAQTR